MFRNIIPDLKVIGLITPGMTLSTTTMTLVNHKTWSGAAWRRYSGENRKITVDFIRDLLNEAFDSESSEELDFAIENALTGVNNLKETYKDDQNIIIELDLILTSCRDKINKKNVVEEEPKEDQKNEESFAPVVVAREPTENIHPVLTKWSRYQIETALRNQVRQQSLSVLQSTAKELVLAAMMACLFS